ncbi:MAG: hypothetical protein NTV49_06550 [Kiritimatiellaeota bacterium]|nr:hypothetical protein [Kiritimatiellota bacterium]
MGLPAGDGAAVAEAATRWWSARLPSAHRRRRTVTALDGWPEWQQTTAAAVAPRRKNGGRMELAGQVARGALPLEAGGGVPAQEVGMMQTNRITKFLELNGALYGSGRAQHWFSLPGRWRLPRFELMRRQDFSGPVEPDRRAGFRKFNSVVERQGI